MTKVQEQEFANLRNQNIRLSRQVDRLVQEKSLLSRELELATENMTDEEKDILRQKTL